MKYAPVMALPRIWVPTSAIIIVMLAAGGHGSYYGLTILGSWFALPWLYWKGLIAFFIAPTIGPAAFWICTYYAFMRSVSVGIVMVALFIAGSVYASLEYSGNRNGNKSFEMFSCIIASVALSLFIAFIILVQVRAKRARQVDALERLRTR